MMEDGSSEKATMKIYGRERQMRWREAAGDGHEWQLKRTGRVLADQALTQFWSHPAVTSIQPAVSLVSESEAQLTNCEL
jgi:hypothetical protein